MARGKTKRCRCKSARIASNGALCAANQCVDVCTMAPCGTPSVLSVLAPVIYDEIGINLCATFDLGVDISTVYPTADHIKLSVTDIEMTFGPDGTVTIDAIPGRPNCYLVTLSDLEVTFVARIYDIANRLLDTLVVTATYLPTDVTDETYDEDTNPSAVELEIYAPYGPLYDTAAVGEPATPIITPITFGEASTVSQGINLRAIPKVLDFDIDANTVTVGLSIFLQSLYYAAYRIATEGKLDTPKGSIIPEEQSACMDFVEGSLLNLNIRPLDIGEPNCEECLKQECDYDTSCGCAGLTALTLSENNDTAEEENN